MVRYSILENSRLSLNIIFSSIIGFSTLSMAWFAQIYFFKTGVTESLYPILWTLLNLTVGLGSVWAYRFEHRLGMKWSVILILTLIFSGYLFNGMIITRQAILFFFIFYFIRGVATPVLKNYINQLTTSDIRATVLSIRSLFIRLMFAALGPLLGWFSDHISLRMALLSCGFIIFLTGGISAFMLVRRDSRHTGT